MKKFKSLLTAFVVALLSAAFILPLAACDPDENADGDNAVYVTSLGGMALRDVTVELLKGSSSLGSKKTDADGKVSYALHANDTYTVKVSDLPAGFIPEASYTVKGSDTTTYVRVNSKIIGEGTPTKLYTTGDVLYDFVETYYTYGANKKPVERKAKLSDFFAEGKKAVLINFFFNRCSACEEEYPAIKAAYAKYSDKLEIIGINEMSDRQEGESPTDLQNKVQIDEVPYLMCKDDAKVGVWFRSIVKGAYPTSIMIDRYGILCDTMQGSNASQSFWEEWFEKYTSDKYSQSITQGEDPGEILIPDKPGDFNATMPASSELNAKINKTGRNILFSADRSNSSMGWPWDLNDDQTAIYPTNTGHRGTFAIIYAQIDLKKGEVLAFDYKMSTVHETDYFYVSLDSREGTGRQISMNSGVQGWQTGYSYAALEDGRHEIEFTYYRSTSVPLISVEDKVYINNLRIVSVDTMNADFLEKQETFELPYFATRGYNNDKKQFDTIESVYLAEDGYYHIGTQDSASDSDPYLLLDLTHSTPYFHNNANSLYTLYTSNVNTFGGMYIKNVDYTDKFKSYISYSTNSKYTGLIPVTEEIKNTINTLFKAEIPKGDPYYSNDGWLQFCVYYKQYGVQQKLEDPIKGLAYFSAFEAHETTDVPTYVETKVGEGKFWMDPKPVKDGGTDGRYVDVEGKSKAHLGNYNLRESINEVHFNTVLMPRGYMYKFEPTKSGVYSINGVDCYYYKDDESIIDVEETDAELYNGNLTISHAYAPSIAKSDSDRYERNNLPSSFKMIHYLEAGKTYYINVCFRVVETLGDFAFRIDYLGETSSYISQASSSLYSIDADGKMTLPLYCEPYYDKEHDVWLDSKGGGTIYVDFTQLSAMFDYYTIEQVLDENKKTAQFKFKLDEDIVYTEKDKDGKDVTVTVHFDLLKTYGKEENIPDPLKGLEIKDYTDRMKYYLEQSKKDKKETDEEYGLVAANAELYGILQLYNAKFFGYDTPDEWLKACCVRINVGPDNHN